MYRWQRDKRFWGWEFCLVNAFSLHFRPSDIYRQIGISVKYYSDLINTQSESSRSRGSVEGNGEGEKQQYTQPFMGMCIFVIWYFNCLFLNTSLFKNLVFRHKWHIKKGGFCNCKAPIIPTIPTLVNLFLWSIPIYNYILLTIMSLLDILVMDQPYIWRNSFCLGEFNVVLFCWVQWC